MMTHIHRDNLVHSMYSRTDALTHFCCKTKMQRFGAGTPHERKDSIRSFLQKTRVYFCLPMAPKLFITMETGKAPHVSRGTGVKICFSYLFILKLTKSKSFSAKRPCFQCERGCMSVFPVVSFDWESSDLAETANVAHFTWPCPQQQPSPFYPSGRPISATPSSAPATRDTAPPL